MSAARGPACAASPAAPPLEYLAHYSTGQAWRLLAADRAAAILSACELAPAGSALLRIERAGDWQ